MSGSTVPREVTATGDDRAIGAVLGAHLRARGLPADSGVSLRWVWVRFLGMPIGFPNFDARREILVAHDVHHLLTRYDTTWRGEAEISGFEIASGCKRYWAAWFFNWGGFLFGLFLCPVRTFCAFVRGRHCANFYGAPTPDVLHRPVAAARAELGLDRPLPRATARDALAFAGWALLVLAVSLVLPLAAATWSWLLLFG